jgi:hypothetical protein
VAYSQGSSVHSWHHLDSCIYVCIFNMRLIFTQSRRFVLIKIQYTRILNRSYNCTKIFFNVRRTNFLWEASKERPTLAASRQLWCLAFSPPPFFFVHNSYLVCRLEYSLVIIFVLVFTIRNYTLTWNLQNSLTFSRPKNVYVNSTRTQQTVHKHFKFSGGTDRFFV